MECGRCGDHYRTVEDAVQAFHQAKADIAIGTKSNYHRTLPFLKELANAWSVRSVDEVSLSFLEAFRTTRQINALTWTKELEILRQFFGCCAKHG